MRNGRLAGRRGGPGRRCGLRAPVLRSGGRARGGRTDYPHAGGARRSLRMACPGLFPEGALGPELAKADSAFRHWPTRGAGFPRAGGGRFFRSGGGLLRRSARRDVRDDGGGGRDGKPVRLGECEGADAGGAPGGLRRVRARDGTLARGAVRSWRSAMRERLLSAGAGGRAGVFVHRQRPHAPVPPAPVARTHREFGPVWLFVV